MIQASKVTSPSLSGNPPLPTDWPFSFASSILQPCSTASNAELPFCNIFAAVSTAKGVSQVAITNGLMGFDIATDASFFSDVSSQLAKADETVTKPKPVTDAFLMKFLLFIFLILWVD